MTKPRKSEVLRPSRLAPAQSCSTRCRRLGRLPFQDGGERRSCAPTGRAGPTVFETASVPRRIHSPNWRKTEFTLLSRLPDPAHFHCAPAPRLVRLPRWRRAENSHLNGRNPSGCFQNSDRALVGFTLQSGALTRILTQTNAFEARHALQLHHEGKKVVCSGGLAPPSIDLGNRRTVWSCYEQVVSAAGFPPACRRLEGAGLMYSTHADKWHLRPDARWDFNLRRVVSYLIGRRR